MKMHSEFSEIWIVSFAIIHGSGNLPIPLAMVAMEQLSGRQINQKFEEGTAPAAPPYPIDHKTLFVAFRANRTLGCHLVLGWPIPKRILDLYVEFRNETNGTRVRCGTGLASALAWAGLNSADIVRIELNYEGLSYDKRSDITYLPTVLNIYSKFVRALAALLHVMAPDLDLPRALLRGRYMAAVAQIEQNGIPINTSTFDRLSRNWNQVKQLTIQSANKELGLFSDGSLDKRRFQIWLQQSDITWPSSPTGEPYYSEQTWKEMAKSHETIALIRDLLVMLSSSKNFALTIGSDGRNRCDLFPFKSRTGRNQPSTNQFIFGPAVWIRNLIKSKPGSGLALIDWSQQEFGIAAALSGDQAMQEAYKSDDPYLAFSLQAGLVKEDACKAKKQQARELGKSCVLAVQYGMGAKSLSRRLGIPLAHARELLESHRQTYKQFWNWSDDVLHNALLHGKLQTVFGWKVKISENPNPNFIRNFPLQANGAEMMRLACCNAVGEEIPVCAPIHDALLIEAPLTELTRAIEQTQEAMAKASQIVLDGFTLRTDVKQFRYPKHYRDKRSDRTWKFLSSALIESSFTQDEEIVSPRPAYERNASCSPANSRAILLYV